MKIEIKMTETVEEIIDRIIEEEGLFSYEYAVVSHNDNVARPTSSGEGRWRLFDKNNRSICSDFGYPWTWVTEWLDFNAADENDLTKIIEGGCEK